MAQIIKINDYVVHEGNGDRFTAKSWLSSNFDWGKIFKNSLGLVADWGPLAAFASVLGKERMGAYMIARASTETIAKVGNSEGSSKDKYARLSSAQHYFEFASFYMARDFFDKYDGWMVATYNGDNNKIPKGGAKTNLRAASGFDAHAGTTPASSLITDPAELAAIMSGAKSIWQAALGRPLPFVPSVRFANLPDGTLGSAMALAWDRFGRTQSGLILLDDDANGRGWYADATPLDGREFGNRVSSVAGSALPNSPALDRYDLLTVVLHEMGHLLGIESSNPALRELDLTGAYLLDRPDFDHVGSDAHPHDLMNDTLEPGERKLPSLLDAQLIGALLDPLPATTAETVSPLLAGAALSLQGGAVDLGRALSPVEIRDMLQAAAALLVDSDDPFAGEMDFGPDSVALDATAHHANVELDDEEEEFPDWFDHLFDAYDEEEWLG
jgi:hypothetical protein